MESTKGWAICSGPPLCLRDIPTTDGSSHLNALSPESKSPGGQHYSYQTSPCGYEANSCSDAAVKALPSHLNVWIQTGVYILNVTSEILASITGLEYEFTKAPRNIRSLVISVFYFVSAISRAIGQAMNPLVADSNLKHLNGIPTSLLHEPES